MEDFNAIVKKFTDPEAFRAYLLARGEPFHVTTEPSKTCPLARYASDLGFEEVGVGFSTMNALFADLNAREIVDLLPWQWRFVIAFDKERERGNTYDPVSITTTIDCLDRALEAV